MTLSAASTQTVTVGYVTANGTATAPSDYAAGNGTVTFAPGVTTQPVAVAIVPDGVVEANETFTVMLQSPVNATLGDASGTVTITNDDAAPLPSLAVNDVSVLEGTGAAPAAVFTVTLSAASTQTVTVAYVTANGTATAPADYAAGSGTLTFAPGVTTQPVAVAIVPDAVVEANETFTLMLQSPVNATLADASGIATITNDDAAPVPSVAVNDVSVVEGTGTAPSAVFTVTLSAASAQTVTVGYVTANGTATAPARLRRRQRHAHLRAGRDDAARVGRDCARCRGRGQRDLHGDAAVTRERDPR